MSNLAELGKMRFVQMPTNTNSLYSSLKKKWDKFKSDLRYDWKYPEKYEPGFLMRSFRKVAIVSVAASAVTVGGAMIGNNWMENTYRNLFRNDEYTLNLKPDLEAQRADNVAPLFVGTAEAKRTVAMQEDLLTLSFPLSPAGANGDFHKEDLIALNWFRATLGIPASEFADGRTLRLLAEQAAARRELQGELSTGGSTRQSVLRKSFVNPSLEEKARIREAQAFMTQINLKIGPYKMNGIMDDVMVASVTEFQKKFPGELIPNGEIDFKTMQKLKDAAYQSLVASGMLDDAKKQGLDDISAIINGQQMTMDEVRMLAQKYIRERGAMQFVVEGAMEATQQAGFDFTYIMALGSHESGLKPWAGAGTSSAYGNFQFTDETWLRVFGVHGAKYGYGDLSKKIRGATITGATAAEQKYIMDLRNNPKVAALMVIEFSRDNLALLQSNVGGVIGKTDLYMAHFLGGGGGSKFIREFRRDNTQAAAAMFPEAAAANKTIFYDSTGKSKSLGDIYAYFSRSFPGNQALRMVVPQPKQPLSPVKAAAASAVKVTFS